MLEQILKDIWRSKGTRFTVIFILALMLFALIFKARFSILTTYQKIKLGQVFNNPITYAGEPYGFTEDDARAQKYFRKGIKKLSNLAVDIYRLDKPDQLLLEEPGEFAKWESALDKEAIIPIYNLLHDMELFCSPFRSPATLHNRIQRERKMEDRKELPRKKSKDIIKYGVTEKNYLELANKLLNINADYFTTALQKKPDYLPALGVQKRLFLAACKPLKAVHSMQTTIHYIEYKTEKEIYQQREDDPPQNAQLLAAAVEISLKNNSIYKNLLQDHFRGSYYITQNIDWKIKQTYDLFLLNPKKDYLLRYVEATLESARLAGHQENRALHNRLKAVMTQSIEDDPLYLYALAETAYRAGYYGDSARYLNRLKRSAAETHRLKKDIDRLSFILNLEE